ncbi:nicotinamide riboside kinase 1-like isoform X2 [Tachypleus tridentatus]|uniref:nicotinamide riboside kinase 1-like isoform X2 n=1 Tax=Tachypleus tridentatus TaxID=6853 RepID=UPI003FD0ACFA
MDFSSLVANWEQRKLALMSQEEYSDKHEMIPELQHVNWESLSSIDWNSLMSKLFELMRHEPPTGNPLLIVEGHLIFNYFPLMQMFDKKYFITLSKEECWERRRVRIYSPPDPPGYFDKCVWPMYMKNKKEIEENVMDVVIFDGAEETISILEKILNDIGAKQDT